MLKNMEPILYAKGGNNRWRIIKLLHIRPYNPHELSKLLDLNYRTILFHLEILEKNGIIRIEGSYGKLCYLEEIVEIHYEEIQEQLEKIDY